MGLVRHDELTRLFRDLNWNFSEFGEAGFVWHGRNSYSFNRLFLVREGEGSLVNHTGGELLRLRAGFGCFMPPRLDLEFDFPEGLRFFSFHFQLEALPGVDLFAGNTRCTEFRLEPGILEEASRLAAAEPGWEAFFRLERFICGFLTELTPQVTLDWTWRNRLKERYGVLLEFVREKATAKSTMEELAAAAERPYDRLSREFKRDFGRTLKEFLAAELCRRAETLLRRDGLSVKETAAELEFGNEFYFSRFFRRHTGMSPRDCRSSRF
ncbi:MAG: helix-turn-helix transcriptional regulator [Lentisphaeria bacterium]|nr:helix-turn-helix transcriptional regulator [Lentisphaeria bacterium]